MSIMRLTVTQQRWSLPAPWRTIVIAAAIFAFAFLTYYFAATITFSVANLDWETHKPINWLNFYVPLADAMNHGTFDLSTVGLSGAEHPDLVHTASGETYLPYQPAPAVLMMPFVAIWGATAVNQWLFSLVVGAINVVLVWYILRLMSVSRTTQLLLVPFFAFGTANFYSATTGTLWFYNHVVAVMFLLFAITFMLRRSSPIIVAFCLGAAFMSRQPTVLAAPFFIYWMVAQRHTNVFRWDVLRDRQTLYRIGLFLFALAPFGLVFMWYNAVRFGGVFDTGLEALYPKYEGQIYTIYLANVPGAERFAEFDLRNIPLHLYTIFLLPPTFDPAPYLPQGVTWDNDGWLRPSEYGMSVLMTSPPFIFAALTTRRHALQTAAWIAIPLVALPTLLYYSQGWVQFGYRYVMDYLPFVMILTALGFEDRQSTRSLWVKVLFVAVAIVVGFWGRYWGTRLGW